MHVSVFDIETDSLDATLIHCLAVKTDGKIKATTSYDNMRSFFQKAEVVIGHNIVRFDIPVLNRLLDITIRCRIVDTLALSWALYPERNLHGLESWGDEFGVPKPIIGDWQSLPIDEYINRCKEDVKINSLLWEKMWRYLNKIYDNEEDIWRYIDYLSFKMDCAREQERSGWKLDTNRVISGLQELEQEKAEKIRQLSKVMPRVSVYAKRNPPAKPFKKDGTISATGARWIAFTREHGLPPTHSEPIDELIDTVEPKPGSHQQVKKWLYSLGWEPITFKIKRDKNTNEMVSIPQVSLENGGGICPSIKLLYDREPRLELLDGLAVISHRISILKGFIDAEVDGVVKAEIAGFTNTLRVKHKTVVNLPKVSRPFGPLIRGSLIAREGYELCGSDMKGLEDRLKQHYIYPYDPDYVNEMNSEDYDPHLSLAVLAKEISDEDADLYKWYSKLTSELKNEVSDNMLAAVKSIKPIRDIFKNGNYACQYGAMPPRLALTAHISLKKAKQVWKAYWKKNWAIKKAADDQYVKTVDGQMWLLNPISGFYYSLRYDKDRFSTLVQGSASFVFDEWIRIFRRKRSQLTAQFHDEVVLEVKVGSREKCTALLKDAIDLLNERLKLNRSLDVDVQYGENYGKIH